MTKLQFAHQEKMVEIIKDLWSEIVALVGFGFGMWQAHRKRKAELELVETRHELDQASAKEGRRYEEYKSFLPKLDQVQRLANGPWGVDQMITDYRIRRATLDEGDPIVALRAMQGWDDRVMEWYEEELSKLHELRSLRLVCSDPTLDLLEDYEFMASNYLNTAMEVLQSVNPGDMNSDLDYPQELRSRLDEITNQMIDAHRKLVRSMRHDIGNNTD